MASLSVICNKTDLEYRWYDIARDTYLQYLQMQGMLKNGILSVSLVSGKTKVDTNVFYTLNDSLIGYTLLIKYLTNMSSAFNY